jgi:protein-tyrosine phosphatase
MKKIRVLFVCLGNICRSPLAEAIFKHKVKKKGLAAYIEADSCGTSNYHIGGSPDPRTMANAADNGVVIEHCGRQLTETDLAEFDFILAMDASNYRNILKLSNSRRFESKIKMMRDYDPLGAGEVPDPYNGGEKEFQEVFHILNRSLDEFLKSLEEKELTEKNPLGN